MRSPQADGVSATDTAPREAFSVELLGRTWNLERHGDLEALWEAMGRDQQALKRFEQDERLPYWTELWPSALLLGKWLELRKGELRHRACLDIGCGLGLSALAGAHLGARVLAIDYEWPAVSFATANARANVDKLQGPVLAAQMDWRQPAFAAGSFHRIWGADVMYERRFAEPLADALDYALAPGGLAWIAEPGRAVYDGFVALLQERGWRCEAVMEERTPPVTAPGPPARVTVWELARAGLAAP